LYFPKTVTVFAQSERVLTALRPSRTFVSETIRKILIKYGIETEMAETRNAHKLLVGKTQKRSPGRQGYRGVDIQMNERKKERKKVDVE
jgi:hypothetical protein